MSGGSDKAAGVVLPRRATGEIGSARRDPVDATTLAEAAKIVEEVRAGGEAAARAVAERLGDPAAGPLLIGRDELDRARDLLALREHELLSAAAERIAAFAKTQRDAADELTITSPHGGQMGSVIEAVESAGCYAPGGRHPLPSSVLMTAVTAREAGVETVIVASPNADPIMLAAAGIARADAFLNLGGAQAIAALAYGLPGLLDPCDAVVGPGNRYVTAAKQLVSGRVAIDMLAGPSEVLIIADGSADPGRVAADLLAQAEHDTDARSILVTTSAGLADEVDAELDRQLEDLPTAQTARAALINGFCCVVADIDQACAVADRVAPEHLQVMTDAAWEVAGRCRHYGAAFIGEGAAECVGDYGIGPNHTLPTGGSARSFGGLSVMTFLRVRTWIYAHDGTIEPTLYRDVAEFARLEGLEAHARSAERRIQA